MTKFKIRKLTDNDIVEGISQNGRFIVMVKLTNQTPWTADGYESFPNVKYNIFDTYQDAFTRLTELAKQLGAKAVDSGLPQEQVFIHSTGLSYGKYKDGTPNALFDTLNRVVCSFPTDRDSDTRRGSPSTPEVILANATLFQGASDLLIASRAMLDWCRERISLAQSPEAHELVLSLYKAIQNCIQQEPIEGISEDAKGQALELLKSDELPPPITSKEHFRSM